MVENEFQSILYLVPWEEQLNGNGINYFPWPQKTEQIPGGKRSRVCQTVTYEHCCCYSRWGEGRGFILDQESREGCLGSNHLLDADRFILLPSTALSPRKCQDHDVNERIKGFYR